MRPVSRAGSLDRNRDAKIDTRTGEGANILSPLGFVEIAGDANEIVTLGRAPAEFTAPRLTTSAVLPITQRSHDNIAAVSVPKQRSSPSRMANPHLIFDEMAIFAVQ